MSLKVRSILVLSVGIGLGLMLSLGGGVLADREPLARSESLPAEDVRLFAEVLQRIKEDYVDSVDDSELMESAIRGMVSRLDPHSAFLDEEEYQEIRISTTGNYSGVGLEVALEDGFVKVVSPIDDTPAHRAGILPGDIIISIDDVPVSTENLNETVNKMRGDAGSQVAVTVTRAGVPDPIRYSLIRDQIEVHSVKSELLEDDYGYIRITHFSETTSRDLNKAVKKLKKQTASGLRGLVLDLRNNPGGVLDSAVDVSDAFLEEGLIVTADGRASESRFKMEARPGDILDGAQLVVLVNAGSASASEIVAGALQDHHRAIIMGAATFGKGSVQTVMPLSSGRAIKLTTSKYFTPSGQSIHERGINPDIVLSADEATAPPSETLEPLLRRDPQLRAAVQELKSKKIVHSKAP